MSLFKIGWLDSARMPSRIHLIDGSGSKTICGYPAIKNHQSKRWVLNQVPKRIHGESRRCKSCFNNIRHAGEIQWYPHDPDKVILDQKCTCDEAGNQFWSKMFSEMFSLNITCVSGNCPIHSGEKGEE